MAKKLATIPVFHIPYRVTEHRKLKLGKTRCDGYVNFSRRRIKLRLGREPWTDLHEIIHAAADALDIRLNERKTNQLARAMWGAGVKAPWENGP